MPLSLEWLKNQAGFILISIESYDNEYYNKIQLTHIETIAA